MEEIHKLVYSGWGLELADIHRFLIKSNPITTLDRPWGFQGGWGSQISRQSAHEGGKVVSPTHRPLLPPRKYSWYSFLL